MNSIKLNIPELDAEGFRQLVKANENLQLERASTGEVIIIPLRSPLTGNQNSAIATQLASWIEKSGLGIGFDSSTRFNLPNGAVYSPDASWVSHEKWNGLTQQQQKEEFLSLVPDFVLELRSSSDSLERLQKKMAEYMKNGVRLGWLIDPKNKIVDIYRQGKEVEVLDFPETVSGEDVLPGLELNLNQIWE
ncbi:MAG: Uma2 family endonuclease [Cyanobacteria bacterium P01_D01_bin.116]